MKNPVLVLSGYTPGTGVIRALGISGIPIVVVYHDKKEVGYASKYVQEKLKAPNPQSHEEDYIQFLLDCGLGFRGSLLIPASDETLAVVSRHKKVLDEFYVVACTDWAVTQRFIDKRITYEIAEAAGVASPKSTFPKTIAEVEEYAKDALFPCLVKPSQSHRYHTHFKKKMTMVHNLDEMVVAYKEAINKGLDVILQEYIPGEAELGANYNSYSWDGKTLVEFTAQKMRNAPPITGSPCVLISKIIEEVIEPGRKIINALGYYGYACTEFKKDPRDGRYKLMEVNGRHNLSTLLSVKCGLNFPLIQYRHRMEGILPVPQDYQTGIYWIDISRDIGYRIINLTKEHYSPSQLIRPYFAPHIFAVFDLKDPIPSFLKTGLALGSIFSRIQNAK